MSDAAPILTAVNCGLSPVPTPIDVLSVAPDSATGSVLPSPTIISPSPKTDIAVTAPVPLPKSTPPSVNEVAPVPPLLTLRAVPKVTVPLIYALPFTSKLAPGTLLTYPTAKPLAIFTLPAAFIDMTSALLKVVAPVTVPPINGKVLTLKAEILVLAASNP